MAAILVEGEDKKEVFEAVGGHVGPPASPAQWSQTRHPLTTHGTPLLGLSWPAIEPRWRSRARPLFCRWAVLFHTRRSKTRVPKVWRDESSRGPDIPTRPGMRPSLSYRRGRTLISNNLG